MNVIKFFALSDWMLRAKNSLNIRKTNAVCRKINVGSSFGSVP